MERDKLSKEHFIGHFKELLNVAENYDKKLRAVRKI